MTVFTGTAANDTMPTILEIALALGNDLMLGLSGSDIMFGWTGSDTLEGGANADIVIGGGYSIVGSLGYINDTEADVASYSTSALAVTINLSNMSQFEFDVGAAHFIVPNATQGFGGDAEGDWLIGIDDVIGSANADTLVGNGNSNHLFGGDGNDFLDGGGGDDILEGGAGGDVYIVDSQADVIVEIAGNGTSDRVAARTSYRLAADDDIEIMTTTSSNGTTAINLTGNSGAQYIVGNAGDNILNGLGGADTLAGYSGDDVYIVYDANAAVRERAGQGNDRVAAGVDYVLAVGAEVESLVTTSRWAIRDISLTGNELSQAITGNEGANTLNGRDGNDMLIGGGGDDSFVFDRPLSASNVDRIHDFLNGNDTIRLSASVFSAILPGALDESAFHEGFMAADANDRIIYDHTTGELFYDADGTGSIAARHFASVQTDLSLDASMFVIF